MDKNKLIFADCLEVLRDMSNECVDLVYIDPPFNSNRDYNILYEDVIGGDEQAQKEAFQDTWSSIEYQDTLEEIQEIDLNLYNFLNSLNKIGVSYSEISYLVVMSLRVWHIRRVLKSTGSFYLHCDPTMSHYLKIVCDLIFGKEKFCNEIVWFYKSGGRATKRYSRKHDILLFYQKSGKATFNWKEIASKRGDFPQQNMKKSYDYDKEKVYWSIKSNGREYYYYEDDPMSPLDVWDDVSHMQQKDPQRLGYPTQKPEKLLEKIIKASSNEGDIVADFFCGCGTTINVANRLKRQWIGVDISHLAIELNRRRLVDSFGKDVEQTFEVDGFPKDIASAKDLAQKVDNGRIKFQDWIIEVLLSSVSNPKRTADGGYDGHFLFPVQDKKSQKVVKDTCLIEVKSGNVNVKNVREFINVVERQEAQMGVFVCFKDQVTRNMRQEAKEAGYYRKESFYTTYDRIQIITVEDLLDGKYPHHPDSTGGTFKRAQKQSPGDPGEQGKML